MSNNGDGSNASSARDSGDSKIKPAPRARVTAVGVAVKDNLSLDGYARVVNSLPPKPEDVGLQPSMLAPDIEERRLAQETREIEAFHRSARRSRLVLAVAISVIGLSVVGAILYKLLLA